MAYELISVLARVKNPDAWMLGTVLVLILLAVLVTVVSLRWRDRHYANDPALAKHAKSDAKKAMQIVVGAIVFGILAYVLTGIFMYVVR